MHTLSLTGFTICAPAISLSAGFDWGVSTNCVKFTTGMTDVFMEKETQDWFWGREEEKC